MPGADKIETVTFKQVLFGADGSRRTNEEAVAEHGRRAVAFAQIIEALSKKSGAARPLSVPRRLFVSYRWGEGERENEWVETLVRKLQKRGNMVVFDTDVAKDVATVTVPELVAKIADCHYFVMVIDPGYIERVGWSEPPVLKRGVAYDEYQVWRGLADIMRIPGIGLLRAGDKIPRGMTPISPGQPGNVYDVREPGSLDEVLDSFFTEQRKPPPASVARQAETLIRDSEVAAHAGHSARAYELAKSAAALTQVAPEPFVRLAVAALRIGLAGEADRAAAAALELDPGRVALRYLAAQTARECGRAQEAAALVAPTVPLEPESWRSHLVLAGALHDLGQDRAAAAHARLAFASNPEIEEAILPRRWFRRALGKDSLLGDRRFITPSRVLRVKELEGFIAINTYFDIGSDYPGQAAAADFDLVLASRVASRTPFAKLLKMRDRRKRGKVSCSACKTTIAVDETDVACALCGADLPPVMEPCSCCGSNTIWFMAPVLAGRSCECPFCHRGDLSG